METMLPDSITPQNARQAIAPIDIFGHPRAEMDPTLPESIVPQSSRQRVAPTDGFGHSRAEMDLARTCPGWPLHRSLVEAMAQRYSRDELEERGLGSEASAVGRAALLKSASPELYDLAVRLDAYIERFGRPHRVSTWEDEGLVGVRVAVAVDPELTLVFWLREDQGYELLIDHVDDELPTRFARRTARIATRTEEGIRRHERLVIAAVSVAGLGF